MPFSGISPGENPNSRGRRQEFASDIRKGPGKRDVRPDNRGEPRRKYYPGSSAKAVTDAEPENAQQVDLRRVKDIGGALADANAAAEGKARGLKAARAAVRYRESSLVDQPTFGGVTPRVEGEIAGVRFPSKGERFGAAGGENYAEGPVGPAPVQIPRTGTTGDRFAGYRMR